MSYLYYTIYIFYKNIIRIKFWGDEPFFYCNIVLALFEVFFISSVLNLYLLYSFDGESIDYSKWWFFMIGMILFSINSYYFKGKKRDDVIELSTKARKIQATIILASFLFFSLVTWLFFYTGNLIRINNGFAL